MADFWSGLGDMFGNITGYNQAVDSGKNQATGQANQATGATSMAGGLTTAQQGATAAGAAGQNAAGIAGVDPSKFASQSGQAGAALGQQMGQQQAQAATQNAAQAARTSGVNKGQAAMLGGQAAGQAYNQGQQTGQQLGMGAYGQGASNQLGAVNAQTGAANAVTSAGEAQGNIGAQQGALGTSQIGASSDQTKEGNKATGGVFDAVTSAAKMFSDKNMKTDIKKSPDLEAIIRKIKPVSFNYKPEAGEGDENHIGVLAQDMEKTPLKANVVDTPAGKMIDTGKQEMSNLNLIIELATKVRDLEAQLKGVK